MTSLFDNHGRTFDRHVFNRAISKEGWVARRGDALLKESSPTPKEFLVCQSNWLVENGIGGGSITVRGAYSSISYLLPSGERISVLCFPSKEGTNSIGLEVSYDWNKEYEDPPSVPLHKVEEILERFLKQLEEACIACGMESIRWVDRGRGGPPPHS